MVHGPLAGRRRIVGEGCRGRISSGPFAAKKPPKPKVPTELEQVEAEISAREERISELERALADDWSNVDVIAAHRRERDELQALLERWEQLFEQAQT